MSPSEQRAPANFPSFVQQLVVTITDLRLWLVLVPTLLLSWLIVSFLGPRIAPVLTLAVGLLASHLMSQFERLPPLRGFSTVGRLYHQTLMPALLGILVIQAGQILARLWMMPWYWFHAGGDAPSCWILVCEILFDWLGFVLSGILLAALVGRRATYAAMVGIAIYLALAFTDVFTGNLTQQTLTLVTSSCGFVSNGEIPDVAAFRYGIAFGLVSRAFLAVVAARVVSSWQAMRENARDSA